MSSSLLLSIEAVFVDVVSAAFCIVNEDIGRRRDLDASAGANAYDGDDDSSVMTTESSSVDVVKIMGAFVWREPWEKRREFRLGVSVPAKLYGTNWEKKKIVKIIIGTM
jgi:hypothetical protein